MLEIGLLLLLSLPTVAESAQHDGFYGGGFGTPPDFTYTQVQLKNTNTDTPQGELWQPYAVVGSRPLSKIQIDGDRLRFEVSDPVRAITFDLVRSPIGYQGTAFVKGKAQPASFVIRPGSPPSDLLATYEGTYELGKGRLLLLSRNNDTSGFWYLELPSGKTGYLFNLSNYEFIAGPCLYCVEPVQFRIAFDESTNGRATGLTVVEPGETPRFVHHLEVVREQRLTFTSRDGRQLAGTLYLPEEPSIYPGVVLVHGSGAQTRNGFFGSLRFLAEAYARAGIATFAYDKQGTGESKGDWERASLDALADDAAAAMEALRKHSEVDAERTGLVGWSQAGYIVPIAAARSKNVRLIQILSGSPSIGVEEQERLRLVLQMEAEGYPQSEIDRALHIRTLMDDYAKTGEGWDELENAFGKVAGEFWAARFIGGLPARDAPDWEWLREAFRYDALPQLERFPGSVQFLFGAHDTPTPVAATKPRLEAALTRGASRDWVIRIVPKANHNYLVARNGGDREFPGLSRYVPGFFEFVPQWAAKRLQAKRTRSKCE